jgi:hypothetical protein
MTMVNPLHDFKRKLGAFAVGEKRGIRNPFVMVPVVPEAEQITAQHLVQWAEGDAPAPATVVYLDRLMPETEVFQTLLQVPTSFYENGASPRRAASEEKTLRDNLAVEIVDRIVKNERAACSTSRHILLLLHLGALYPFARASELLDEMDRRRVKATIGIPFPGEVIGGKLSFFGERAQHYYPAHRIDGQIAADHLQT